MRYYDIGTTQFQFELILDIQRPNEFAVTHVRFVRPYSTVQYSRSYD
jgi:hypothetical protein